MRSRREFHSIKLRGGPTDRVSFSIIVEQVISTALMVEGDMDWGVRLKSPNSSHSALATYKIVLLQTSHDGSRYGNNWDIRRPNRCGEVFSEQLEENT